MVYPEGYMNLALYMKILSELPKETVVVPFFRGEPTLHPYFSIMMHELKSFREVQLATNGDNLTAQNKNAILDTCTFLSISLHEFKYPNETKFLGLLYDALGRGIDTQISIVENILPQKHKGFVKAWQKYVNRVRIYKEHSKNGFGSMTGAHPTLRCSKPFEDMVVYWNGRVGLCNHDWNNQVLLGDLNVQSIIDVWNDTPYQEVRELHKSGNRSLVASCRDCDFQSNKVYGEILNGIQK